MSIRRRGPLQYASGFLGRQGGAAQISVPDGGGRMGRRRDELHHMIRVPRSQGGAGMQLRQGHGGGQGRSITRRSDGATPSARRR